MRKILAFFRQRWVISLLGVIALSLLIWFVGPLIAIADMEPLAGELTRMVVILVLVLLWGLSNLRAQMKANRADKQLAEGMAEAGESAGGDGGTIYCRPFNPATRCCASAAARAGPASCMTCPGT